MEVRIMSWNMAGAKLFEQLDQKPEFVDHYIAAYQKVWLNHVLPWLDSESGSEEASGGERPDIILLQECIGLKDHSDSPSGRWQGGELILQQIFVGYECFFFPAVTSSHNAHPGKWNRTIEGGRAENTPPAEVERQQGYGICIRKGVSQRKLWVPWADAVDIPEGADRAEPGCNACFETVNLTTTLYQGSRDTEPRLVIMGRVKLESEGESRYLNYLNVHLNTVSGEREGDPDRDREASASRLKQVELILDHVVAAYQQANQYRMPEAQQEDIWIMGGDFNAEPGSAEIEKILASGFVDTLTDKHIEGEESGNLLNNKTGSKWSLIDRARPPLVADYIFCGMVPTPPTAGGVNLSGSRRPFTPHFEDETFATDHALLFTAIHW